MRCLVCNNDIRIATLKQIFSPQPLILCDRCDAGLRPASSTTLFETTDVIQTIVARLDRGDLILLDILKRPFIRLFKKYHQNISSLTAVEAASGVYPWEKMLAADVMLAIGKRLDPSGLPFVLTSGGNYDANTSVPVTVGGTNQMHCIWNHRSRRTKKIKIKEEGIQWQEA